MPRKSTIQRAQELIKKLSKILAALPDEEVGRLCLNTDWLDKLIHAILDPTTVTTYSSPAAFLPDNKQRATVLALVRHIITNNYSFKEVAKGQTGYVSPNHTQWFENGVMFLEG